MAKHPHPAEHISWRAVESSNIEAVGWDAHHRMYVKFKNGGIYMYEGVTRQRVVCAARAGSVGHYINTEIIPNYAAVKIWTTVSQP